MSHTRNLAKRDNTVPLSLSPAHETYALAAELDGLGVKMQPNHFEQRRTGAGIDINLCGPVWRLISAATIYVFLVGLDLGFLCSLRAVAQNSAKPLPLPHLEPCQHVSHPLLPPKWRGVFLMAPFTGSQLALSESATFRLAGGFVVGVSSRNGGQGNNGDRTVDGIFL